MYKKKKLKCKWQNKNIVTGWIYYVNITQSSEDNGWYALAAFPNYKRFPNYTYGYP